jgi:hypothetical protein
MIKRNQLLQVRISVVIPALLCAFNVFSQIQTVNLPDPGFETRIKKAVNEIWIVDTHEHLQSEEAILERKKSEPIDFTHLFQHYIIDDLISAGYTPHVQQMVNNRTLPVKDRWEILEPFWEATRNTGYARAEIITARELYGIHEINSEHIEELSKRINDSIRPGWYLQVLKEKARIELSILDGRRADPGSELFRHVTRFDNFIFVSAASEIRDLGKRYNIEIGSLRDYEEALKKAFQEGADAGMVAVKSGLAYNRRIYYENTSQEEAEAIFRELIEGENPSPMGFDQVKPLQDYMMHRVLDQALEYDLPVQIHTGLLAGNSNEIRNSKPTDLTNLFLAYPGLKFCIFHSGYPYGGELSVLAKNYPNVYIDMCWSQIISPYYCERYLHEWLETVPASKIMAFGGDFNHVESVYGHSVMAREVVAKVLIEKVEGGYFTEGEAIHVAQMLLRENALEIFRLKGRTRDLSGLPALSNPGYAHDLWEMVKSGSGLIREWMVIGPFPIGTNDFPDEPPPPGFEEVYPPEEEIDFTGSYEGEGGEIRWQKAGTGESGILDFNPMFPQGKAIVYAYSEITSPDRRKMKFTFGSDDGAKVWINGKLVYNEHAWRALGWDGDVIEADLKKGKNTILVKVEDKWLDWSMMMRVMDMDNEIELKSW